MSGKNAGSFRIEHQLEETVFFGDIIDLIGKIEDKIQMPLEEWLRKK